MKLVISALTLAAFLAISHVGSSLPASAQSQDVRAMCNNKHGLGKAWATAPEPERKRAAAAIAACIRSGGKS